MQPHARPRLRIVMERAPGCVLITVIALDFVTGRRIWLLSA
ncbi:hypothetical protein [Rhizobium sp. L43]|nr:hypothetical protein [Rhizobium sp. L43]